EMRAQLPLVRHYKEQISAAFVALFRGEQLFLVRGRKSGLWQLPGGMIEASDASVWEAATREFFEETGSLAALPAARLGGWYEVAIQLPQTLFKGVIFVLQMDGDEALPFAANEEATESIFQAWESLSELEYRWPNDQTIPQMYDQ
ncbi:mutT, partial [Symbiodinium microadriaticum]